MCDRVTGVVAVIELMVAVGEQNNNRKTKKTK